MPHGVTNKDLAYRFNNFFIDKITKIRNDLIGKQQQLPFYVETPAPSNTNKLCRFQPITLSNLQKIIRSTPNKSCDLDPILTSLLNQILPSIVTIITDYYYYYYGFDIALNGVYTIHQRSKAETIYGALQD